MWQWHWHWHWHCFLRATLRDNGESSSNSAELRCQMTTRSRSFVTLLTTFQQFNNYSFVQVITLHKSKKRRGSGWGRSGTLVLTRYERREQRRCASAAVAVAVVSVLYCRYLYFDILFGIFSESEYFYNVLVPTWTLGWRVFHVFAHRPYFLFTRQSTVWSWTWCQVWTVVILPSAFVFVICNLVRGKRENLSSTFWPNSRAPISKKKTPPVVGVLAVSPWLEYCYSCLSITSS